MSIETIWEDFTSSEKHLFQKSCRRLLKQTFLVRDKDEDYKKMYYFVAKRQEVFEQYFSFIGFDIVLDRENGVVMLRNSAEFGENGKLQGNRLRRVWCCAVCGHCMWTACAVEAWHRQLQFPSQTLDLHWKNTDSRNRLTKH